MKNGKFIRSAIIALCLAALLAVLSGCGGQGGAQDPQEQQESVKALSAPLNIGTLMGPTGMGMAGLASRAEEGFNVSIYDAPDQAMAGLLNGELDVAAIPSNVAAVLWNKTEGGVQLLGVNTGGVLYVLSSGVESAAGLEGLRGKTVYASGMGGVPEYAFKALMQQAGIAEEEIELVWMESHADVVSTLIANGGYALVPEPQVSAAAAKSEGVSVDIDINALWEETFGYSLPMGVIACRTEVAQARPDDLVYFLNAYYDNLTAMQADAAAACETIASAGIVPNAGIARSALPRCNIMLETAFDTVKGIISPLYDTLHAANPKAVGGTLPDDSFYFAYGRDLSYSIRLEF